ncbi:MAG TPA: DinB family protein [Thermoanaerobaculia bacterium]|nr:DinB family protein [Thermoanaerobaculia bacterium]
MVTHSAYHRGQIISHIRAAGQEPPYIDFIQAARTGMLAEKD